MPSRWKRYRRVLWRVLWTRGPEDINHAFAWADSEEEGDAMASRMNAVEGEDRLFWCEKWTSSSVLNHDDGRKNSL